jgi:SAM-dependent methyltransferase
VIAGASLYHLTTVQDDLRRATLETWEAMAPGWERWRAEIEATSTPVREWLIRELEPRPGDTILELAAGPGDTGFEVAGRVGEEGRVISTDLAPAMVEVARRRSAELGLRNVEHRVLDAERIDLPDDSVDGVVCRFGFMLMPDVAVACSETRRVLREGGRLAVAVWRDAEANPWISIAGRMLVERGHAPRPEPGAPGIFALADEDRLREVLETAGFTVERIGEVPVRFTYRSVDDYVRRAQDTGGLFATVWRAVSDEEHEGMKARLGEGFAPFAVAAGYELPGLALAAVAS